VNNALVFDGHGDGRAPYEDPCPCGWDANLSKVVDGVDAMRLAVREELRRGAHQIKLFVSGGVASPSDPIWMMQFAEEEIRAAVDEATRRRTYVLGHAYGADTIARSVRCGVRSIEHGNLLDTEAADVMAEHGAFLVPTLVTYDALNHLSEAEGLTPTLRAKLTQVIEHGGRAVEIARAAGVKIGLGTDLLGHMQDQQLHEFRLRGEVDTPLDVLRSATSVNAELLQMDGEIGCVAPGAHADLLAFDGNPLEDLSAIYGETGGPAVVIKGGEVIIGC
jgi:imidazolonepropionase-like amidohydrolase